MQYPHISRRHFVLRSCAAAIISAVIPNRGQPEALPQENRPNKPTNPQPNSQPHHILVPVYREGKFIEDVEGDRNKQGTSFVIRIPNDDGLIVPPHRHPEDEHITVIQGTWYLGPGERFDRGVLEEMPIGAYARVPKGMAHFAWSRGETIIQVHGIGPFRTDFLEPVILLSEPNNQPHFKYKAGQRVLSQKGLGVIAGGGACVKQRLVQYQIRRDEGGLFVALEEDLTPVR